MMNDAGLSSEARAFATLAQAVSSADVTSAETDASDPVQRAAVRGISD